MDMTTRRIDTDTDTARTQATARRLVARLRKRTIDAVELGDASLLPTGRHCYTDSATRLITVLSGRRRLGVAWQGARVEHRLVPGRWVLLPPHATMWPQMDARCHFVGLRMGTFAARLHASRHPMPTGKRGAYLGVDMPGLVAPAGQIEAALLATRGADPEQAACRCALSTAMLSVLAQSLRGLPDDTDRRTARLATIHGYVQEHLHRDIDRNTVARRFDMAPATLSRLFSASGTGFNAFLNAQRLAMAIDLLRASDASVEAVAQACGFSSSSYFIKRFREQHRCTPQQWRDSVQAQP